MKFQENVTKIEIFRKIIATYIQLLKNVAINITIKKKMLQESHNFFKNVAENKQFFKNIARREKCKQNLVIKRKLLKNFSKIKFLRKC